MRTLPDHIAVFINLCLHRHRRERYLLAFTGDNSNIRRKALDKLNHAIEHDLEESRCKQVDRSTLASVLGAIDGEWAERLVLPTVDASLDRQVTKAGPLVEELLRNAWSGIIPMPEPQLWFLLLTENHAFICQTDLPQ